MTTETVEQPEQSDTNLNQAESPSQDAEPQADESQPDQPTWESAIRRITAHLASSNFPQNDLAILAHRFEPERFESNNGAFWRILVRNGIPFEPGNHEELLRWAVLIKGAAQITQSGPRVGHSQRNAHNPNRPVGRVLYLGDERRRTMPLYPSDAMKLLLSSTGAPLRHQVVRALATIHRAQANCDFTQVTALLHADLERSKPDLTAARLAIAQPYYTLF